jgi:hypothetical protein
MKAMHQVKEDQSLRIFCNIDANPTYSNVSWYVSTVANPTYRPIMGMDPGLLDYVLINDNCNRSVLKLNNVRMTYDNARFKCEIANTIVDVAGSVEYKSEIATQLNVLCMCAYLLDLLRTLHCVFQIH